MRWSVPEENKQVSVQFDACVTVENSVLGNWRIVRKEAGECVYWLRKRYVSTLKKTADFF